MKSGDESVVSRTRLVTYEADDSTEQRDHELENGAKRMPDDSPRGMLEGCRESPLELGKG